MLPHDSNAELTVLGTLLTEPESYHDNAHLLFSEIWYSDVHREVYEAIKRLALKNKPIDITTVTNELKVMGKLDYVGGYIFMASITSGSLFTSRLEHHIRILTEYYVKRTLITEGNRIITRATDPTQDIFELINSIENGLTDVNNHIIGDEANDSFDESIERTFKHLSTPREERHTGIKTDNPFLTDIIGGWNEGNLIIIAARPSMGKTSRVAQIGVGIAEQGKNAVIFSLEMTKEHDINTKLLNIVSELDSDVIKTQSWNGEEFHRFTEAKNRLKKMPIYVNDKSGINPNYIRSICRQRKKKYGLDMIIIDYLQLMESNEGGRQSNNDKIGSITKSLKSLAKDLRVPIICLSQLSRQCEERPNKRPQMRDLRDSGNIEQDADVILTLYRPFYYDQEAKENEYLSLNPLVYEQVCEIGILKNRMGGANDRIREYFDMKKSKFNYKM